MTREQFDEKIDFVLDNKEKRFFNAFQLSLQRLVKQEFNIGYSLSDVSAVIHQYFSALKYTGSGIAYVAGAVTADGPAMIETNFQLLNSYANKLYEKYPRQYVFSSHDIMNVTIDYNFQDIKLNDYLMIVNNFHHEDFMNFWRQLLESGLITKIYLAPGWQRSKGACEEREIALEQNIQIEELSSELLA